MFWIGFFSFYIIIGLLAVLMLGSQKLFDKFAQVVPNCKRVVCAIVFTLFSYIFTLIYSLVAMVTGHIVIDALICSLLLVFSWIIVEKMYQLIADEKVYDDKKIKVLTKEDKNVCNLFALIGVILSGVVLCYEDSSLDYVILISIAISIWIGAYIPISGIYEGMPIKELLCSILKEFESKNASVWISSILSTTVVTILGSKNEVVQRVNELIEEIGLGIAVGTMVFVLALVIWSRVKNAK